MIEDIVPKTLESELGMSVFLDDKKEVSLSLGIEGDYSFIKNVNWFENEILKAVGMSYSGLNDLKIDASSEGIRFNSKFDTSCEEKHKIMMIYLKGLHIYKELNKQGYSVPEMWSRENLY